MPIEEHKEQPRGKWWPISLWYMWERKEITSDEFILLGVIDGLVKVNSTTGKITPCYASNEYLAKRMRVSKKTAERWIYSLKSKQLLIQTKFTGRKRFLLTSFSGCKTDSILDSSNLRSLTPQKRGGDITDIRLQKSSSPTVRSRVNGFLNNGVENQDKFLAKKFEILLRKNNNYRKGCRPGTWATTFHQFRTKNKITTEQLTAALDSYAKYYQELSGFKFYTAKWFCNHYEQILSEIKKRHPPELQIKSATKEILQSLSNLHWPKGSETQLPQLCEISRRRYRKFRLAVYRLSRNRQDTDMQTLFRELPGETFYIVSWFQNKVFSEVFKWERWNGDLSRYVFTFDHKWFFGLLCDICGGSRQAKIVLKRVTEEMLSESAKN